MFVHIIFTHYQILFRLQSSGHQFNFSRITHEHDKEIILGKLPSIVCALISKLTRTPNKQHRNFTKKFLLIQTTQGLAKQISLTFSKMNITHKNVIRLDNWFSTKGPLLANLNTQTRNTKKEFYGKVGLNYCVFCYQVL